MEKEFNLSEKIVEVSHYDNPWREHLFVKDVKEFIKLLKEKFNDDGEYYYYKEIEEEIDKLAGDDLI